MHCGMLGRGSRADVTVSFHTALGTDPLSDQMLEFARSAGIECTDIPRLPDRRPGLYSIHLQGAERSFTYWRDTSAARLMMRYPEALWLKVAAADILYISGITLAILPRRDCENLLNNLPRHKANSAAIAFDPNIRPHLWDDGDRMRSVINQAAALSDIILPSFDDERSAFGDPDPETTAKRYRALGANHVVVKNGPDDTIHLHAGDMIRFPVARIDGVIDTTAAGDSFNGAYVAALVGGCRRATRLQRLSSVPGRSFSTRALWWPNQNCLCEGPTMCHVPNLFEASKPPGIVDATDP